MRSMLVIIFFLAFGYLGQEWLLCICISDVKLGKIAFGKEKLRR